MEKVGQFMEKNLEWFCIGIALVFVGWCAWTYILTPVTAKMGTTVVRLDDVDKIIEGNSAKKLANAMGDTTVPPFHVDDFSSSVRNGLSLVSYKPPELASTWNFQPLGVDMGTTGTPAPTGPQVKQLPALPALVFLFSENGRSTVLTAAPVAPAAAAAGVDPSAAPVAPAPVAPISPPKDINWVTMAFSLPSKPLSDEWMKSFGPEKGAVAWKLKEDQVSTWFLSLVAYRSEKLPNGQWSSEVEVARLFNNQLNAYPKDAPRQNADAAKQAAEAYADWAKANAPAIITPPIPTLAPMPSGDDWKDPLALLPTLLAPAGAPAAPANPAPATPIGPAPAPAPVDAPPQGPAIRGSRGRGATAPPSITPTAPPPAVVAPVVPSGPTQPTVKKSANLATLVAVMPAPVAKEFNPYSDKVGLPDILVYLHDEVGPAKTYRYRLDYKLYNPLFNFGPDKATNKGWVTQLALAAPKSSWTDEIVVPPRTYFYCAQQSVGAAMRGAPGSPFVFEVISWSQGQWHKHNFTVYPGDQIGGIDAGIDYVTGYTFIDARFRSDRQTNVLLLDPDGNSVVRDAAQDANGADRKQKQQLVAPAAAAGATPAAAAPAAAPSGTPAPPPGP